ncbi:hypothetical protein Snoj_25550 [Streptomyces nojiriensis]|uniref:Uncharacterized protein n=1 Tax=Streptomyces nojiriensis TaxID=66374 RepID=A0ABQ3SKG6_9ACTN|nr:hypothetical protein [Streptomyces nojiriensis]QTI50231.1 hypothetical protein JYK04_08107 [Streptomyces nojiriensis]GGS29260.1 hypothetical protein GCM10010205_69130 [Streptomyces nojiriensis]GHI68637.1 hypothetical protein Snoj_25550 [Streptomyces nojiriensis]
MSERNPPDAWEKFDGALQREILTVRPAEVAVLIVLTPGDDHLPGSAVTRGEAVDAMRRTFGRRAEAVVGTLVAAGGRDIRESWLNHTVAARISITSLLAVAGRPEVRQVLLDSPRQAEIADER